jgi:hypothetical protein
VRYLTKTRYLNGLQCPKLLWTHYNAKDLIPPATKKTETIFEKGRQVGELAKQLYPEGIEVPENNHKQTKRLIKKHKPLFEAGFETNNTYARADILNPRLNGAWDIIEVKQGTGVKEANIHDVAMQKICYEAAGLMINKCWLMHINRDYVRQGPLKPRKLFTKEDITAEVRLIEDLVKANIQDMQEIIASDRCPDTGIGPHCDSPYECELKGMCWKDVPDNSVLHLCGRETMRWELYETGVETMDRLPGHLKLAPRQRIQVEAAATGEAHVDRKAVRGFLDKLVWPVRYMDFETFGFLQPVPLVSGSRPYSHVPFQFSVHLEREPGGDLDHFSWLWDGHGDPWEEITESLMKCMGDAGSVVVYNRPFEGARLNECAARLPDCAEWVRGVRERMVDLLTVFRNFGVYYPSQRGSASLKVVLPALTGHKYDDLDISEGTEAGTEFVRVTFGDVEDEDRQKVRADLEAYCGLDTYGMVEIVEKLRGLADA